MSKKVFVQELQRDLIALAGWPFYLLVFVRLFVGVDYLAGLRLLAAALILGIIALMKWGFARRAASAVILTIVVIDHYNSLGFGIFAGMVFVGMVWSLIVTRGAAAAFKGLIFGALITLVTYAVVNPRWFEPVVERLPEFFQPILER